jgi:hypothetical protein
MAISDMGSMSAHVGDSAILRGHRESPQSDSSFAEPDVSNRWHPAATLGFIVASCALLWGGIFVALGLLF